MDEGAESQHAEAYRVLRTNLLFSRKDDKLNTIVVVSAGAGEGKSTTVVQSRHRFRPGRQAGPDRGLRPAPPDAAQDAAGHQQPRVSPITCSSRTPWKRSSRPPAVPTLDFHGQRQTAQQFLGILSSAQMKELIAELKQRYDFVFFDSPPIMGVSDASILASEVDMVMQVIQYRRYPQPMNIRAKQMIEKVGGNLVGIVLNNINMSQDESYYYYSGYYHDYYYSEERGGAERRSRRTGRGRRRRHESQHQTKVLIPPPTLQGLAPMKLFVRGLIRLAAAGRRHAFLRLWLAVAPVRPVRRPAAAAPTGAGQPITPPQGDVAPLSRRRHGHITFSGTPG